MNSEENQPQKPERQPDRERIIDAWEDNEEQNARLDRLTPTNEDDLLKDEAIPLTTNSENEFIEGDVEPVNSNNITTNDELVGGGSSAALAEEINRDNQPIAGDIISPNNLALTAAELERRVADLQRQEQILREQITRLQASYTQQAAEIQASLARLIQEGLSDLEQRKQTLQIAIEQLERRQERIRTEMKTSFAGVSQDLAIRVQGFKDYLVGSLQDLASAAEQLPLVSKAPEPSETVIVKDAKPISKQASVPPFAEQGFQEQAKQIRKLFDQYRTRPDYYGPPWQLRRTFEPIHAERASYWFFSQGGKGALRTMGSRLQNILIASSIISVLRAMYDDRLRTLILANSPERLGEWRRGLQDCLGISRGDFGPERGLTLFEAPEALAMKAERLVKEGEMPLIIIDETEDQISLSVLQFPLWLAFAPDPQSPSYAYDRDRFDR